MSDPTQPPALGPLINQHRKARRLTLDQLAAASGVSRSMLSQIERGETNPTVSTLWNVARALNIDMGELIAMKSTNADAIEIVAAHFTPEIRSEDGRCVLRILSPPTSAGTTEWYELDMSPGAVLASTAHATGTREHLTVMDGALTVESGGQRIAIEAGGTARYPADVAHVIRNEGTADARAFLVVASR